jgi:glycosyltransferase involved in cell wall biosynthesis
MSRILLCGLAPLPGENTPKSYGPGIRTWQFAWSLAHAGHEVRLLAMRIPDAYGQDTGVVRETIEGIDVERMGDAQFLQSDRIARELETFAPDAVVGATIYGSYALARHQPRQPFWADQFGDVLAEAQAKATLDRNNAPIAYFWRLLQPVLGWADKLSVVSDRQRYAAIGQLGTCGRLSLETCGYDFTSVIPCAFIPETPREPSASLRGRLFPDDAFVVLWSGSYNTWSDVDTLFRGVETAMRRNPRIHFLSTGGEIPGHDERTYRSLVEQIERSALASRFHLAGWIAANEVPSYWAAADLGVLCEQPIYEGLLGSKNRVVQWMGWGLPVAYNQVGDLGDLLAREALGLTFRPGHAEELSAQILRAVDQPTTLREMTSRAQAYVQRELTFAHTTRELVAWAGKPSHAPDAARKSAASTPADFTTPMQTVASAVTRQFPAVRHSSRLRALWHRLAALR